MAKIEAAATEKAAAPGLRAQLVHAVIGSAGVRIAGMAVTFLIGVQLARYLGPTDLGSYGSVIAVTSILAVIAQAGLPQLLTREMSTVAENGEGRAKGALVYFSCFVLAASLLLTGVLLLAIETAPSLASHLPRDALLAGLALVPLTALIPLGTGALRGFHRAIDAQFQDALLRPAIFAVLLFASMHFASSSMDALSAIELQVASGVLALLAVGVSVVVHLPPKLRRVPVSRDGRRWAASAVPMAGTELLRIIDGQVPILLLGVLVTLSDVGIYRVASAIAAFVALPATLINLVVMSHVAQLHGDGNRVQLQKVLVSAALVPFVASVATTLGLFFVGRQAIEILFGQAFVPAWGPLCIASAAWCVNAFFGCGATLLNMCGKERALVVTFLLSTIFNLVLIGLLAPTFGAMGVAISLLCVETFRGVAVWLVGRRMLGVDCSLLGALSYVPSIARRAARSKRAT